MEGNSKQMNTKLRILCLHGYKQNGEMFKSKLGSFRKLVKNYAEFVFISAPHKVTSLDDTEDRRSWWFNKDDGTYKGNHKSATAVGFEESIKFIENYWNQEGPFDGILGFSQGACLVALLCSLNLKTFTTIRPQFVILASGFISGCLTHLNFYKDDIHVPSLHIFGENDERIPSEMSEKLASLFRNQTILRHSGGHYIPATSQQKQLYINFLQNCQKKIIESEQSLQE